MKSKRLLLGLIAATSASATAETTSYSLPITRDGKTINRVASTYWSGEYPTPVIDVHSRTSGSSTIAAYKSLRDLTTGKVQCTIMNGLYHPWAKKKNSVINFYSITPLAEYLALKEVDLEGKKVGKGSKITFVVYAAEGYCNGRIAGSRNEIQFSCDLLDNKTDFKAPQDKDDKFREQWIHVKCAENYQAFIRDTDLLKQPGIKAGEIKGFGEVKAK